MTDSSPINIVLATDDKYAQHMGIVMLSCLNRCAQASRLSFYLLCSQVSNQNKQHLRQIVDDYSANCTFIDPDESIYQDIDTKRFGVAGMFRLSISTLLPPEVERVIYLDCDVLVFDDIAQVWDFDLQGRAVGAVTNVGLQFEIRLGVPEGRYFNSGVLLIDLNLWRAQDIGEKALSIMTSSKQALMFPDQDGLNLALLENWTNLPLRWNSQPGIYSSYAKKRFEKGLSEDEYHDAIFNPGIVHFLGRRKPWNYLTFHPLQETYSEYLKVSPWKQYKPDDFTLKNFLIKNLSWQKSIKRWRRRMMTPRPFKEI